jgi:DNA-binding HxlR family transcriptional regulator
MRYGPAKYGFIQERTCLCLSHQKVTVMKMPWLIDNPLTCPMVVAINTIGGKWKPIILHMLSSGTMRFNELKRNIPPLSQKVLTQHLRELEHSGIVNRTVYPEVPPRVEYCLSALGKTLVPVLESLYRWGEMYADSRRFPQVR